MVFFAYLALLTVVALLYNYVPALAARDFNLGALFVLVN